MNLFLFSGGSPEVNRSMNTALFEALKKNHISEIVYIATPAEENDFSQTWLHEYFSGIVGLKFIPYFIDAPNTSESIAALANAKAIVITGGNTFYIAKHLQKSETFLKLFSLANAGCLIIGFSAGSIVQTPTIAIAQYPTNDRDKNNVSLTDFTGLNLVKFEVHPHYSQSPQEDLELIEYSKSNGRPIYALTDGTGIIVDGIKEKMYGTITMFDQGMKVKVACDC